jgi:hypothetical protein
MKHVYRDLKEHDEAKVWLILAVLVAGSVFFALV